MAGHYIIDSSSNFLELQAINGSSLRIMSYRIVSENMANGLSRWCRSVVCGYETSI